MVAWERKSICLIGLVIFLGERIALKYLLPRSISFLAHKLYGCRFRWHRLCRRRILIAFITFPLEVPIAGNSSFLQMYIRGYISFTFSTTTNRRWENIIEHTEWMEGIYIRIHCSEWEKALKRKINKTPIVRFTIVQIFHVSAFICVQFFERRWTFVFHSSAFPCQDLSFVHMKCSNSLSFELLHLLSLAPHLCLPLSNAFV